MWAKVGVGWGYRVLLPSYLNVAQVQKGSDKQIVPDDMKSYAQ